MKTSTATLLALTTAITGALPAMAQEVNVYSYRQPELIQPLMDAFTEETGIAVNVAFLNKGMIERLEAEGSRSPADVILTTDISRLAAIVDADLAQPVESEVLAANIPATLRDPNNEWFGLTSRARVVYASKDRVADGELTSYEDLADPKWAGRICTRSGTHAYTLALVAAFLHHNGEEATTAWLEGVKANLARKPQGNDRAQVKAIWSGECDISLGNTYYMGAMVNDAEQKEWADSVRILFPVFEGSGTHVNVSGVALTKHAPHKEDAIKLMEFLSSPEAQRIYAEANTEYPANPEVKPSGLVAEWGEINPDDLSLQEIANNREAAVKLVDRVDYDG